MKIEIIKEFLAKAELLWPLTIAENRERAKTWIPDLQAIDPDYAKQFAAIIESYEKKSL